MAITPTSLGVNGTGSAATSHSSASASPSANRTLVAFVGTTSSTSHTVTGWGLTWNKVVERSNGATRISMWIACTGPTAPGSGNLSISLGASAACGWSVLSISEAYLDTATPSNAVVQSSSATHSGSGGPEGATLGSAVTSGNLVVAAIQNDTDSTANLTFERTSLHNASFGTTPNRGRVGSQYTTVTDTQPTFDWNGSIGGATVVAEIKHALTGSVGQVSDSSSVPGTMSAKKGRTLTQPTVDNTAQAIAKKKSRSITQPSEGDSALTITRAAVATPVGQASETDLSLAAIVKKQVALGQASESDSSQPVAKAKSLLIGMSAEADSALALAAIAKAIAIGQPYETGVAQAVGKAKAKALGLAEEDDLAHAVAVVLPVSSTLGRATESDSALAVTKVKVVSLGRAPEFNYAWALERPRKSKAVGQVSATNTALHIAYLRSAVLMQPSESDAALAIAKSKAKSLGVSAESDVALTMTRGRTYAIAQAAEADVARTLSSSKLMGISTAHESDLGMTITRMRPFPVGQPSESDLATAINTIFNNTYPIGTAAEVDTALALSKAKRYSLGQQASELDLALGVVGHKAQGLGQALEGDLAQPLSHLRSFTIGAAAEDDLATAISRSKRASVGQAWDAALALPVLVVKRVALGFTIEFDEAQRIRAYGGWTIGGDLFAVLVTDGEMLYDLVSTGLVMVTMDHSHIVVDYPSMRNIRHDLL